MTTRLRYEFVEDVSSRNVVFNLGGDSRFAAGVWTVPAAASLRRARLECLRHAFGRLAATWPDWEFWLAAGHKTLQSDNRITRYNGLWKSLAKAGVSLPRGDFLDESLLEFADGVRVFGAVRFIPAELEGVHAVMQTAQAAVVFAAGTVARTTIPLLVERGWPQTNTKPPREILEVVCPRSGLVVDAYGEFDDSEAVVAAIGQKEVLADLRS